MSASQRWKAVWLTLWAVFYLISLALPVLVDESTTIWDGWQAAIAAFFVHSVLSRPLGAFLVMLYPLLVASLFGILRSRPFAAGTAIALVATMSLWGFMASAQPRSNIFGGTDPGGSLGAGFWLWLASGLCLLVAALSPPLSRRHGAWSLFGFGYAALVVVAAAT